ncbi:YbaK/EbsC family protein [Patescibacteria group bacterium]|nr:YbaK/EbsC family protein [Patescibacteria group bacterium]
MAILKSLQNLLEKNSVKHEVIEHKTVYTAHDSAETQHIKPQEVVKTLVMKISSNKHVLALIPAHRNLDKKKLLKEINVWLKKEESRAVKTVEFAKEAWMKKNMKGKIGATVPFGSLAKMKTFIDKSLLKNKDLIINTGDYNKSIKLATAKFLELEDVVKGLISKAKPVKKKIKVKPKAVIKKNKIKSKVKPRAFEVKKKKTKI